MRVLLLGATGRLGSQILKELNDKGEVIPEGFNHSSTVSIEFVDDKKTKKKLIIIEKKVHYN